MLKFVLLIRMMNVLCRVNMNHAMFDQWELMLDGLMNVLGNGMCFPQLLVAVCTDLNIDIVFGTKASCFQEDCRRVYFCLFS